jgi:hypothetical protein
VHAQEPLDKSLSLVLAPHYATGSSDLDDRRNLFGSTIFIKGEVRGEAWRAYLDSEPQISDVNDRREIRWNHVLREAYLDFTGESYDFRLGRQLMVWGRADRFNPTDLLTPADFRFLTTEQQGERFGVFAAQGRYYLSEADSVVAVLLPEFRSSTLPSGFLDQPFDITRDEERNDPSDRLGFALKYERDGPSFDFSLNVLRSFSALPAVTSEADGQLRFINPEIRSVGGDFAADVGAGLVLRGEAAYVAMGDQDRFPGDSGPQDYLFAVFGAEREIFGGKLLVVQGLYREVFDHSTSSRLVGPVEGLERVNNAIFGQFEQRQAGVTASLSANFLADRLKTEIAAAVLIEPANAALRAEANYQLTDHATLSSSLNLFAGPYQSNFGVLEESSRLMLQLRLAF